MQRFTSYSMPMDGTNGGQLTQTEAFSVYREMYERFKTKKKIYNMAYSYNRRLDIFAFMFPLMVLQVVIACCPMLVPEDKFQEAKVTTTILASITGIWIGAQQKIH